LKIGKKVTQAVKNTPHINKEKATLVPGRVKLFHLREEARSKRIRRNCTFPLKSFGTLYLFVRVVWHPVVPCSKPASLFLEQLSMLLLVPLACGQDQRGAFELLLVSSAFG